MFVCIPGYFSVCGVEIKVYCSEQIGLADWLSAWCRICCLVRRLLGTVSVRVLCNHLPLRGMKQRSKSVFHEKIVLLRGMGV